MNSIALFALLPLLAAHPEQEAKSPGGAGPGVRYEATVQLTFVSFGRGVSVAEQLIDMRSIEKMLQGAGRPTRDAKGRVLTTGVGAQEQISDFDVAAGGFRLHFVDGQMKSERLPDAAPDVEPPWTILAAPRIRMEAGQDARLTVGQTVPYMTAREDGSLVVQRSDDVQEGADVRLKLEFARPDAVRFSEIRLRISRVAGREPIKDVPFEVGRPIIDTRETVLAMTVDAGRVAIIPLPQGEEDNPIVVLMTVEASERRVEPGK